MGLTPMRVKCPHQRTSGLRNAKDELERHRVDNDLRDGVKSGRYSTEAGVLGMRCVGPSQHGRTRDLGQAGELINLDDGRRATLDRGESFQDHPVVRKHVRNYGNQGKPSSAITAALAINRSHVHHER